MEHKKYQIILADPPWNIRWQGSSSIGTKPLNYPTMTITELVEFGEKVKSISADCSKLFMWTTNAFLPEADFFHGRTHLIFFRRYFYHLQLFHLWK